MNTIDNQPKIFISYSWKDRQIIDTLEKDWTISGLRIIRDTKDLIFKENIKEFMNRVHESDFVLLIISRGYLTSKNCMYEVLEMLEDQNFKKRVLPIVLDSTNITSPQGRLYYLTYWEAEIEKLNKKLKNLKSISNTSSIQEDLNQFSSIRSNIDRFLGIIIGMRYLTWAEAIENNYKPIFDSIGVIDFEVNARLIQIFSIEDPEQQEIEIDKLSIIYPEHPYILNFKGSIANSEKKFHKAKYYFERIVNRLPNFTVALYNLAILLENNFKEFDKAKAILEHIISFDNELKDAHYRLAFLLRDHFGDYLGARLHFEIVLQIDPNDFSANHTFGYFLAWYFNEYELAKNYYERALIIDSTIEQIHTEYAIILWSKLKDYEKAIFHCEKALTLNSNDSETYSLLACVYLSTHKNLDKAQYYFEKSLQINTFNGTTHYNYAVLLTNLKERNPDQIRYHLEQALKYGTTDSQAHFELAQLLEEYYMDYSLAREHYNLTLVYNYDHKEARLRLIKLLDNHFPECNQAIKSYEEILKVDPENSQANYELAILLINDRLSDVSDIKLLLEKAIKGNLKIANAHYKISTVYKDFDKDYNQARFHLEKAIEIDPDLALAHNDLGVLLQSQFNEVDLARYHYEIAIKLKPDFGLAFLNLGSTYIDQNKAKAREYLEAALGVGIPSDANMSEAHFTLGEILSHEFKDYEKAKFHYEKSIELLPNNALSNYRLSVIFMNLRDYNMAKQHYITACKLNSELRNEIFENVFWNSQITCK